MVRAGLTAAVLALSMVATAANINLHGGSPDSEFLRLLKGGVSKCFSFSSLTCQTPAECPNDMARAVIGSNNNNFDLFPSSVSVEHVPQDGPVQFGTANLLVIDGLKLGGVWNPAVKPDGSNTYYGGFPSCLQKSCDYIGSIVINEPPPTFVRTDYGATIPGAFGRFDRTAIMWTPQDSATFNRVALQCAKFCRITTNCKYASYGWEAAPVGSGYFCKFFSDKSKAICPIDQQLTSLQKWWSPSGSASCSLRNTVSFQTQCAPATPPTRCSSGKVDDAVVAAFFKSCTKPIAGVDAGPSSCDFSNAVHIMSALQDTAYPMWASSGPWTTDKATWRGPSDQTPYNFVLCDSGGAANGMLNINTGMAGYGTTFNVQ